MSIKYSIIIRSYNEEKYLGRLLSGIIHQTLSDIEIILVDSGSTDNTLFIAKIFSCKMVFISPEEFSFGRSLNFGCEVAKGEFLLFISAHCYPLYGDWLEKLCEPFQDPKVGLVYGKQRGNFETRFSEEQIFKSWYPDQIRKGDVPFCNNANAAIRKSVWEKFKYNESLTGLEDLDFAKKIHENNYLIVYEPDAFVIHCHKESSKKIINRNYREALAMRKIYPDQKCTIFDFIHMITINIIYDCIAARKENKNRSIILDIFLFRTCQFLGVYYGFNKKNPISKNLKKNFYYP